MYAFIEGEIIEKTDTGIVIKPDGTGIGYSISLAPRTSVGIPNVGKSVRLYTVFLVREDFQGLYGFETHAERDLFNVLLKISGLGGKTALAILDLPRDRIVEAIAAGDSDVLKQVKGVGAKTAARIVLELRDRFADELIGDLAAPPGSERGEFSGASESGQEFAAAVEALSELGYVRADARDKIRKARAELGDDILAEDLIRYVLKHAG